MLYSPSLEVTLKVINPLVLLIVGFRNHFSFYRVIFVIESSNNKTRNFEIALIFNDS